MSRSGYYFLIFLISLFFISSMKAEGDSISSSPSFKGSLSIEELKDSIHLHKYKEHFGSYIYMKMSSRVKGEKRKIYTDSIVECAYYASKKYNIDILLLLSVAYQESHFYPKAKGKTRDEGLYQLTPWATREWERHTKQKIKNIYNIQTNTEIAAWFIKQKMNESNEKYSIALAKYNAGKYYKTIGKDYYKNILLKKSKLKKGI